MCPWAAARICEGFGLLGLLRNISELEVPVLTFDLTLPAPVAGFFPSRPVAEVLVFGIDVNEAWQPELGRHPTQGDPEIMTSSTCACAYLMTRAYSFPLYHILRYIVVRSNLWHFMCVLFYVVLYVQCFPYLCPLAGHTFQRLSCTIADR